MELIGEDTKAKNIVNLEEIIYKLFENAAKNEEKIDYNDFKYNLKVSERKELKTFSIDFLKYGTPYELLDTLMLGKRHKEKSFLIVCKKKQIKF